MNCKTTFAFLAALGVLAVSPINAFPQHAGFRAGIAQPQFGVPTPRIPVTGPHSTFAMRPVVISPPAPVIPAVPLVPNFPTAFVPNQVYFPGQPVYSQVVVNPLQPAFVQPHVIQPTFVQPHVIQPAFVQPHVIQPALPAVSFVRPVRPFRPVLGTPRAEVLRLMGQPSVTVITSTGETLYFTGGVTVIIQNGHVAGPR